MVSRSRRVVSVVTTMSPSRCSWGISVLLGSGAGGAPWSEGRSQPPLEVVGGGGTRRGDEDGVVAGYGADHVVEQGLVEHARERMGSRGRSPDHHERGGGAHGERGFPEGAVEGSLPDLGRRRRRLPRRDVPVGGLREAEGAEIAG